MMDFSLLNDAVLAVFGEDRIVAPVVIGGVELEAIFDSRHFAVEDGEAGASDLVTAITVRTAELPAITDSTVIVARGRSYRRWEERPDGQGMTTIQLELAP